MRVKTCVPKIARSRTVRFREAEYQTLGEAVISKQCNQAQSCDIKPLTNPYHMIQEDVVKGA